MDVDLQKIKEFVVSVFLLLYDLSTGFFLDLEESKKRSMIVYVFRCIECLCKSFNNDYGSDKLDDAFVSDVYETSLEKINNNVVDMVSNYINYRRNLNIYIYSEKISKDSFFYRLLVGHFGSCSLRYALKSIIYCNLGLYELFSSYYGSELKKFISVYESIKKE